MKSSEFEKQKKAIASEIKRLKIIDKAYEIATKLGKGETIVYTAYTKVAYQYTDDNIWINLCDGYSMFGGGRLEILWKNKCVFRADRVGVKVKNEDVAIFEGKCKYPSWAISCYNNNSIWIDYLKTLYKNRNKKPVTKAEEISEPDVEQQVLQDFKERFRVNA